MHYKIRNIIIQSEYSAKSMKQPSTEIIKWIQNLNHINIALDYGCGKLRYAKALSNIAKKIILVDSTEQITRDQIIDEGKTNLREYVRNNLPNATLYCSEEYKNINDKVDVALCSNVLSAIPKRCEQYNIVNQIKKSLKTNGCCLFVTHYKDTYFAEALKCQNNIKHLDGWISTNKNHASYYGIINLEKLEKIVKCGGLKIIKKWDNGKSAFVIGGF